MMDREFICTQHVTFLLWPSFIWLYCFFPSAQARSSYIRLYINLWVHTHSCERSSKSAELTASCWIRSFCALSNGNIICTYDACGDPMQYWRERTEGGNNTNGAYCHWQAVEGWWQRGLIGRCLLPCTPVFLSASQLAASLPKQFIKTCLTAKNDASNCNKAVIIMWVQAVVVHINSCLPLLSSLLLNAWGSVSSENFRCTSG